jgi:hypothetical protein
MPGCVQTKEFTLSYTADCSFDSADYHGLWFGDFFVVLVVPEGRRESRPTMKSPGYYQPPLRGSARTGLIDASAAEQEEQSIMKKVSPRNSSFESTSV